VSRTSTPLICAVRHNRRGQVLIMVAALMLGLIGMLALVIDIGHILVARRQLQATTDAAATAGAQDLPDATAATNTAIAYSAMAAKKNYRSNLPGVTMAATGCRFGGGSYPCVGHVTNTGLPGNNVIVVKQQVTLPSLFGQVLDVGSVTISATATASIAGGVPHPIDAIVIVDATASMGGSCSASIPGVSSPTRLDCAKAGVRAFISALWPCAQGLTNCGSVTNGHVVNPVDEVGLMVFPGLRSTTSLTKEYDCTSNLSSSDNAGYGSLPPEPVYLIVGLSSDYRTSSTSGLNGGSSNLVKSVDWADGNSCTSSHYGLENPGGQGSYFAGVITRAQSTLVTTGRANVQKVIIFVSDGDATRYSGGPSNPCHLAITAAQTATAAGTWVYSIAYGANSSGCSDDSPSISSLQTMQQIASDASKFFNQPNSASLTTIFQAIASDLTTTRLLDDSIP
jgi:Flp pilus assembly protein TadG